jgi:Fe-only nitrogenase delta subunit
VIGLPRVPAIAHGMRRNVPASGPSFPGRRTTMQATSQPIAGPYPRFCEIDLGECRTDLIPLLNEMSELAGGSGELGQLLRILLRIMQRHMKVIRGMVNLYDPTTGKIFIHRSLGLSEEEQAKGVYLLGEGVTGKVVESGEAIVVPRIGDEPDFLNRTGSRGAGPADTQRSFLCVPIKRGRKVMGTISAERLYDNPRLLELDLKILSVLAAMTAQAAELYLVEHQLTQELEDENLRLRKALREKFRPTNIIGNAKPMLEVYKLIERVAPLENYIMKHCLWQFNSRGWDRRKQNAGILGKATLLLCGEPVENPTLQEKCYWVDAVMLDRNCRERFPWLPALPKDQIKALMGLLHARMDWLTIDGSLNLELTVPNY